MLLFSLFSPNLSLAWAGAFVGIGLIGCSGGIGIHWSDKDEGHHSIIPLLLAAVYLGLSTAPSLFILAAKLQPPGAMFGSLEGM